ncbi:MAG: amidase [Alphaproteobacteria bacterium]
MADFNLSQEKIAAAEELLGISYTADEREQMLSNLEGQILSAKARRRVEINNDSPMASRFDPRLPHFIMPIEDGYIESECNDKIPQNDEEIAFASVRQQASWIERREITSRRLVEIYLDRIERYSANLECFTVVLAVEALKEADAMDALISAGIKLSPLHGIPYGLKDLFDTNGIITGWGAEPYKNRVPSADAEIVKKLRRAGAILIAKTSVGALAYNDIWYGGRTRNPWNTSEGSSGSSAGSASATAAGLCSFSIGTETLGSITSPSNRCGTTGLRPTFGRVSRRGGMALCWSLDKVGPICRYVEDTGRVLSVLNGYDPGDLGSIEAPFSFDARATSENLRVGYLAKAFGDGANEIDHNALEAVKSLGFKIHEVELEDLPYMSLIIFFMRKPLLPFSILLLHIKKIL